MARNPTESQPAEITQPFPSQTLRNLYQEFWNDKEMVVARHLINNQVGYDDLRVILARRIGMTDCNVPWEDYQKLEIVDNFCSILVRARSFGLSVAMSPAQEDLWGELLYNFWVKRIKERPELQVYVERYWTKLLVPVEVTRRKRYMLFS